MKILITLFIALVLYGCAITPEAPKLTVNPGFTGTVQLANTTGKRADQVARSVESEFIRIFPSGTITTSKSGFAPYALDIQVNEARLNQTSANREEKNCARYSDPDPKAQGFIAKALSRKCLSWETKIVPCTLNNYELDVQLRIGDAQKRSLASDRKVFQQNERVCQGSTSSPTTLMAKTEQDAGQWVMGLLSQIINTQKVSVAQNINPQAPIKEHAVPTKDQVAPVLNSVNTASVQTAKSVYALVIGNGRYKNAGLNNPINDANDIAKRFTQYGFTVKLHLDADRKTLIKALTDFQAQSVNFETNILFYAGHGIQFNGINYIIPVDMALEAGSASIDFDAISTNQIVDKYMRGRTKLVFLDACRDNPLSRSFMASRGVGTVSKGLAPMDVASGTLISYATKDGNVALDGDGKNSPYTEALLKHLDSREDISLILRKVRQEVMSKTKGQQVPWDYGSLVGGQLILSNK